jgi:hypothetical protein
MKPRGIEDVDSRIVCTAVQKTGTTPAAAAAAEASVVAAVVAVAARVWGSGAGYVWKCIVRGLCRQDSRSQKLIRMKCVFKCVSFAVERLWSNQLR